jgi:hypothetical protein
MERAEICVCGHPQSLHRTYACNGWRPHPDPKKTESFGFSAKHSNSEKLLMPVSHE